MHYLMIKKCIATGLKYLCKTSSIKSLTNPMHPYQYLGSGVRWRNHLKKHGDAIITCIIGCYDTKEELAQWGLHYSKLYNVVESSEWANLTEEKGDGGLIGNGQLGKRWKVPERGRANMRTARAQLKVSNPEYYERKATELKAMATAEANHQFKGWYITPWGKFASIKEAVEVAKNVRSVDPALYVITDGATMRKYFKHLDVSLPLHGRRTPSDWRGKTPRELGFDFIEKE